MQDITNAKNPTQETSAKNLAESCSADFFEAFIRAYTRKQLQAAIEINDLSEGEYSTYVEYRHSASRAGWYISLSKSGENEVTKSAYSLENGIRETLRRHGWRESQVKYLENGN